MKFLRESKTVKTVILVVAMCFLVTAFSGCIIKDLYEKYFINNGHWHYNDKGEKDGCIARGDECIYGGAKESIR